MKTKILRKTRPRRSLHPLVGLRLEFWNGAEWECGHPEHRNMTEAAWRELKPKVRRWSCPWRVISSRVEAKSRKQPNPKVRDAASQTSATAGKGQLP